MQKNRILGSKTASLRFLKRNCDCRPQNVYNSDSSWALGAWSFGHGTCKTVVFWHRTALLDKAPRDLAVNQLRLGWIRWMGCSQCVITVGEFKTLLIRLTWLIGLFPWMCQFRTYFCDKVLKRYFFNIVPTLEHGYSVGFVFFRSYSRLHLAVGLVASPREPETETTLGWRTDLLDSIDDAYEEFFNGNYEGLKEKYDQVGDASGIAANIWWL